jgi:hypothetical protein
MVINPKELVKERNPARRQLMKRSGLGRKFNPMRESPSPSRCRTLIRSTIGVNITKHGLFIPQFIVHCALHVKKQNQKQLKLLLQSLKVLNLMNETVGLFLVLLMLGN